MPLVAEVSTAAAADPRVAWEILSDPRTWTRWWPDLEAAECADHRKLSEGSSLELVVRPRHSKVTLRPTVDLLIPGKALSLTHRGALLQGTIAWTIDPHPEGIKLGVRGVFRGLMTLGNPWLHHEAAWRSTLARAVRGLKRAAEMAS